LSLPIWIGMKEEAVIFIQKNIKQFFFE